jgi:hypothetical protein
VNLPAKLGHHFFEGRTLGRLSISISRDVLLTARGSSAVPFAAFLVALPAAAGLAAPLVCRLFFGASVLAVAASASGTRSFL